MGVYFLDTSALVKRYVTETGSGWARALCQPAAGHLLVISQAALAETVAAFCRKEREGVISIPDRDQAIVIFRQHVRRSYSLQRVTTAVYSHAGDLCRVHRLRAYDAIQLACALTLRDTLTALGQIPTFLSSDADLVTFASAEGLPSDNPLNHP